MIEFCEGHLVFLPSRVAQEYDFEEWGAAAGTEAQWCHHFEFSKIPGKGHRPN